MCSKKDIEMLELLEKAQCKRYLELEQEQARLVKKIKELIDEYFSEEEHDFDDLHHLSNALADKGMGLQILLDEQRLVYSAEFASKFVEDWENKNEN